MGCAITPDLLRDLLADGSLHLRYDEEMIGYSWDAAQYPACPKPEPEIPAETQPEESTDNTSPEETTPDAPPADDAPDAETPAADAEQDEKNCARFGTQVLTFPSFLL